MTKRRHPFDAVLELFRSGNLEAIERYLAQDPPLGEYASLPLIHAVSHGQRAAVDMILAKAGAEEAFRVSPHIVDIACLHKHWELAEYLVERGAPPRMEVSVYVLEIVREAPASLLKAMFAREGNAARKVFGKRSSFVMLAVREKREDILGWMIAESPASFKPFTDFFFDILDNHPDMLLVLQKHGLLQNIHPSDAAGILERMLMTHNATGLRILLEEGLDVPMATLLRYKNEPGLRETGPLLEEAIAAKTRQLQQEYRPGKGEFAAAEAGLFPELARLKIAAGEKLDAGEIVSGLPPQSVLILLQLRGQMDCLLDCRLWKNPQADFERIAEAIDDPEARAAFAEKAHNVLQEMRAGRHQAVIRKQAGPGGFKL